MEDSDSLIRFQNHHSGEGKLPVFDERPRTLCSRLNRITIIDSDTRAPAFLPLTFQNLCRYVALVHGGCFLVSVLVTARASEAGLAPGVLQWRQVSAANSCDVLIRCQIPRHDISQSRRQAGSSGATKCLPKSLATTQPQASFANSRGTAGARVRPNDMFAGISSPHSPSASYCVRFYLRTGVQRDSEAFCRSVSRFATDEDMSANIGPADEASRSMSESADTRRPRT